MANVIRKGEFDTMFRTEIGPVSLFLFLEGLFVHFSFYQCLFGTYNARFIL